MMTKVPDMKSIASALTKVPYVASAVDLLRSSAGVDSEAAFHSNDKFRALCEAVIFDVAAKRPFFEVISRIEPSKILNVIKELNITISKRFTYKEFYALLMSFSTWERRTILESLPLTSKGFNCILSSLESDDYDSFSEAINDCDSTDWLDWLVTLQYIRYGCLNSNKNSPIKNHWLSGLGFDGYFRNASGEDVNVFLEREQLKWSGKLPEPLSKRPRVGMSQDYIPARESDSSESMANYSSQFGLLYDLWDATYFKQWTEYDDALENAVVTVDLIFKNEFDHNHRTIPLEEHDRTDWENYLDDLEWIAVDDIVPLRRYISITSAAMVEIFNIVKTVLPEEVYSAICCILRSNPYTAKAEKIRAKIAADRIQNEALADSKYIIPIREFFNQQLTIVADKKDWIYDYVPQMSKLLEDHPGALAQRTIPMLLYGVAKPSDIRKEPDNEGLRLNTIIIHWKDSTLRFDDAYKLFVECIETYTNISNWSQMTESSDDQTKILSELRKYSKSEPWISEWIEVVWSDKAQHRFNKPIPKTRDTE